MDRKLAGEDCRIQYGHRGRSSKMREGGPVEQEEGGPIEEEEEGGAIEEEECLPIG